jgi:hypothetical protein
MPSIANEAHSDPFCTGYETAESTGETTAGSTRLAGSIGATESLAGTG